MFDLSRGLSELYGVGFETVLRCLNLLLLTNRENDEHHDEHLRSVASAEVNQ